jgi:hypothetical protein
MGFDPSLAGGCLAQPELQQRKADDPKEQADTTGKRMQQNARKCSKEGHEKDVQEPTPATRAEDGGQREDADHGEKEGKESETHR